jgi:hypothetical protein
MTNEQYKALWEQTGARTFIVVDTVGDKDEGSIVASSFVEAQGLHQRAMQHGTYSANTMLVEIVEDGILN